MPKKLIVLLSLTCACFVGCGPKTNWEERAGAGDAEAQFRLGINYDFGNGVPEDDKEAIKWYRLAADQGYAKAQHTLGMKYGMGEGVPQDDQEAAKWFRLAADQGYADAQFNLGMMYSISGDYVQAYAWLNLASAKGLANAKEVKDDLATLMTPEQIARAQELSRELDKKINAAK